MKTSLATTISIVGVLAAGAGAFAVNTAVLNVSSNDTAAMVQEAPITATSGVVNGSSVNPSDQPAASPTSSNVVTTPSLSPSPASATAIQTSVAQTSTYKVGDAGRVILEVRNNSLAVANVLPTTGWQASRPEYDDGEVEVKFYSGSTEVEFKARLVNGEIRVFVETENEEADDSYEREYHDDDHDDDKRDDD